MRRLLYGGSAWRRFAVCFAAMLIFAGWPSSASPSYRPWWCPHSYTQP